MRMKNGMRRVVMFALATILTGGCLTGCGSSSSDTKMEYAQDADYGYMEDATEAYGMGSDADASYNSVALQSADKAVAETETVEETEAVEEGQTTAAQENNTVKTSDKKKIIKTYNFRYDTEKFDEAYAFLKKQINEYGGYISSSDIYGTDYRSLNLTARIPAEQSDQFASQLGTLGTLVSQSESAEDISLQYSDTESRIKALKTEQNRLNALLEKADTLENIIELENRLTDVRYELERYESQKRLYDDKVAYSTVNISLEEVKYTVEQEDDTVLSRISVGLKRSFRDIQNDFADFVVWFIVNLPYLIIWAVIIFIIVKIVKRILRKRKAKREFMKAAQNTEISVEEKSAPQKDVSAEALKKATQEETYHQKK